jgi:hypothetical protein
MGTMGTGVRSIRTSNEVLFPACEDPGHGGL